MSQGAARAALFDFDGTLTRRSSVAPFFLACAASSPRRALRAAALLPRAAAYLAGAASFESVFSAATSRVLSGMGRSELASHGASVAGRILADGGAWPEPLAAFDAHLAAGDAVAVVTGGHEFAAAAWLERRGLAGKVALFSSTIAWAADGGVERAKQVCVGDAKLDAVRWARQRAQVVWAYGNSNGDLPMLRAADAPRWVDRRGRVEPWPRG